MSRPDPLVTLRNGLEFDLERRDYPGFSTNPMSWHDVREKFMTLASQHAPIDELSELASAIESLETLKVRDLTRLLARVSGPAQQSTMVAA